MFDEEKLNIKKEDEPYGLGCALDAFVEIQEVEDLIDNLENVVNATTSTWEKSYERFLYILSLYSEQCNLLDKHIDRLLEKMINIIRDPEKNQKLKHMTFKYLFVLVNVRGYKAIVKHLPHEVADFEPVLQMLENQDPEDCENWATRYTLILWLSIIVMIPFHLSRLDGDIVKNGNKKTVMCRVLDVVKAYSIVSDKCRDAAVFLAARFLTRSDVKLIHLGPFFEWVKESSLADSNNPFIKHGTLGSTAMILKYGKREDLLPYARDLLQWIISPKFKANTGTNIQKLVIKIIQRIGLTFLPPRITKWRYKRGNRSLTANLSAGDGKISNVTILKSSEEEAEDGNDISVPEEVEEVVDQLIQGLGNADGVVRWSAAKGIGRVTGRLPKELADEVVGSVLQLFNPREGDGAWQGGCLALAELGRRGLLLPHRLPEVVNVVLRALVYDEPRGYASVGSHIRDAACYVCWSFARAYDTFVLKPYVNGIASTLLVVTCFDREINCRRGASAAFQENVGRQGTLPHGIDILTFADFYAVSLRSSAYLQIASYVAQFEEYKLPLIDHLVERKVDHWDCGIRELTAEALHNLTSTKPEYMAHKVLPLLFKKAHSLNLNSRHGAVLAIGDIIYALSILVKNQNETIEVYIKSDLIDQLKQLISVFREKLYFKGLGGELMRQACCYFIEKCSLAGLPFHNDVVIEHWLSIINESLSYDVINIRNMALKALPVFLNEYYNNNEKISKQKELLDTYLELLLSTNNQLNRMGHAMALGAMPHFMLKNKLKTIIEALIEATTITPATAKWAEARRDCVKGLTNIIITLGDNLDKELPENVTDKLFYTFLEGLKDYTQDKRGDIGAWMREASILGLQTLILLLNDHNSKFLKADLVMLTLSRVSQQAVEKIDRTRKVAGKVFCSFIHHEKRIPHIPHHKEIMNIFPKEECESLNWNSAGCTFPKFVQLLKYPEFTYHLLLGIICSVGGQTESLVKYSSSALFAFLEEEKNQNGAEEIIRICNLIRRIFIDHQKNDRIIIPMFRFLDKLFESVFISCILQNDDSEFAMEILKLVQLEMSGCKDIYKLMDGTNLLCQFIQIKGEVGQKALVQLSIMLCHRQAYIRKSTATRLYESLLVYSDNSHINPESLDEILQLLSTTNWEDKVEIIKPLRNELCRMMGVRVPTPKTKPVQS